jgi:hypothetical protein
MKVTTNKLVVCHNYTDFHVQLSSGNNYPFHTKKGMCTQAFLHEKMPFEQIQHKAIEKGKKG